MLPEIRCQEYLFEVPKFDINASDVKNFMRELKGFHEIFSDCFHRSESRGHFFRYMVGQFSKLERKSIEPIALNVENGAVRPMQRFISDAEWDDDKILRKYHGLVNDDLGAANGALIFDESGFVKKGRDSIGVARQYSSNVGKVENCQVGVFAAYVSPNGYSLLDKRLYIPEKWFTDDYKTRRKKCRLPDDIEFKTKPQLAVEMFNSIVKEEILPFKYVLADSGYGTSPEFIEAVESCIDKTYFVSVPGDTQCWLKQPVVIKKQYRYKGEVRTKKVLEKTAKKPITIDTLAKSINDYFWYKRKVTEGTKGPIEYEFTRRRITLASHGLPQKEVWLVIRRSLGENPAYKFYISNAHLSARLSLFVWLSGLRWAIEQCFEETKSELGLDHYEVRKYRGWHHHMLTCMLAHFFLWHIKIQLGKKSAIHYSVTASDSFGGCVAITAP